jgi:hypothetical protein
MTWRVAIPFLTALRVERAKFQERIAGVEPRVASPSRADPSFMRKLPLARTHRRPN